MTLTEMFRRDMNLFEAAPVPVIVTINGYVAVSSEQMGMPPFPTSMSITIDDQLDRDGVTAAVKAEIQAATGYEPSSFTWRYDRGEAVSSGSPDNQTRP